jgi:hypothetical protein
MIGTATERAGRHKRIGCSETRKKKNKKNKKQAKESE